MFVAVWRFTTSDAAAFEEHYGPNGTWAQLFRRDANYVRTDLLRGDGMYLTLDWWTSRAAYERFRVAYAADYAEIDRLCEEVTTGEEKIGEFDVVGSRR
jgi:hypothetical protein